MASLLHPVPPPPLPRHIAMIMDGNGRWAAQRRRPRVMGHRAGAETVRRMVRCCGAWGIEALTLYAFSTENWSRPADEVDRLMQLLDRFLRHETPNLEKNNVRLRVIGDPHGLAPRLRDEIDRATRRLSVQKGLQLNLAINYGGRDEILRAARALAREVAEGRRTPESIDAAAFDARLDTAGLPEVDLVIRTAGEMRISNYLLWQSAYAEFWTTPICWPAFDADALRDALASYRQRVRKFGGLAGDTKTAPS